MYEFTILEKTTLPQTTCNLSQAFRIWYTVFHFYFLLLKKKSIWVCFLVYAIRYLHLGYVISGIFWYILLLVLFLRTGMLAKVSYAMMGILPLDVCQRYAN